MEVCSSHRRIRSSSAVRAQTHTASVSTTASVPLARTTPWGRGQGWFLFASDCSRWSHSTTPSERTCPPPSRPAVELKKQIPALLKLTNPGATSVAFKVSVPSIGPHKKIACGATSNTSTALTHSPLQVKTTSPKKYVVRPNTGVVPPGGVAEVSVFHRINSGFVTLHA